MVIPYFFQHTQQTIEASQDPQTWKGSLKISEEGWLRPYTAIKQFISDLLGGYRLVGNRIILIPPKGHPLIPWCRCTSVKTQAFQQMQYVPHTHDVQGIAGVNRIPIPVDQSCPGDSTVGKCKVMMEYATPNLDPKSMDSQKEIDILSEQGEFSYKTLTIPNQFYKWEFSGAILDRDPKDHQQQKIIPEWGTQLTRHRCLTVPFQTISYLVGKINKNTFQCGPGLICPPQTCRFEGLSYQKRITTANGLKFYEITYKFKIRPEYSYIVTGYNPGLPPGAFGPPAPGFPKWNYAKGYVGWNRVYNFGADAWERWTSWRYQYTKLSVPSAGDPPYFIHELDEDWIPAVGKIQGGFNKLFDPNAI